MVGGGNGCLIDTKFVLLNEKNLGICYTAMNILNVIELCTCGEFCSVYFYQIKK